MRSQLEKERVEVEAQLTEKLENLKKTLTAEIEADSLYWKRDVLFHFLFVTINYDYL